MTGRRALSLLAVAVAVAVGAGGCTKEDSLVLLDLRSSGALGAPVAHIRLSAKRWPTRTIDGTIDTAGFRVGYYGPGDGSAVSVLAEAFDEGDCLLGSGSATVPALKAGATSAPTTLFVRPAPGRPCVPDVQPDAGSVTDAGEDAAVDAGADAEADAGTDAAVDAGVDAEVDAGADAESDTVADATDDSAAPDAGADGATPDAGDDASTPDAGAD
jgi:hypothetical protein